MKTPTMIDKAFFLKGTRLFADLDLDLLLAIADKATFSQHKAGEELFAPEQDGSRMYLITKGKVQILDAQRKPVAQLGPGDFFGDESLFNDRPRGYYALTALDTQFLTLSRTHLLHIISECPAVALALLEAFSASMTFRPRDEREAQP